MAEYISGRDVVDAISTSISRIWEHGELIAPRDNITKEILHATVVIRNPLNRLYIIPGRNDNIFAKIAETIWTLQGRDDIDWLSWYLPRAKDFSDDGRTWRGAYGPRLNNWAGVDAMANQIKNVVYKLSEDPDTRQAVISLWDPSEDFKPTKDVPCNNWIHFIIRDKTLHMSIAQRSSDVWWGFSGIDAFFWGILHQMMAFWVGAKVGTLNYFITSFHLYERHFKQAEHVAADWVPSIYAYTKVQTPPFATGYEDLQGVLQQLARYELLTRNGMDMPNKELWDIRKHFVYTPDPLIITFCQMLFLYNQVYRDADGRLEQARPYFQAMPDWDFKLLAIEYFTRKLTVKEKIDYVNSLDMDREFSSAILDAIQ